MPKTFNGVSVSPLFNPDDSDHVTNLNATLRVLVGVDPRRAFGADVFYDRIKFTDWSPDTCGCVLRFMWHRDHREDNRQHHPHQILKACPAHAHLQVTSDHHAEVTAENQHKNRSVALLAGDHGVEPGSITHSYDNKRLLHLHHSTLPAPVPFPRKD